MTILTSENLVLEFPLIPLTCFEHDKAIDQEALCCKFKEHLAHIEITAADYKRLLWTYSTCQKMIENGNTILSANGVDVKNDQFEATLWLYSQKKSCLSLHLNDQSSEQPQIIRFDFENEWDKIITN